MKNIKIYIVSHKECTPYVDNIREIIKVGNSKTFKTKIQDDTGDNIAEKNPSYCELTALYWIWKNDKTSDIVGIEHYRRQFISSKIQFLKNKVIDLEEIEKLLNKYDAIVVKKWFTRKQNLEKSIKYSENHNYNDFVILEDVIKKQFNDYYKAYRDIIYDSKGFNPFNMIICNKELFDEYCKWLFEVLKIIETKIDISNRTGNLRRVYGYMSEILLTVWLQKNKINYYENDVILNEGNKVKKFLRRQKVNIFKIINK